MTVISAQGVRPGSINMGRILRNLRHHSDMSRKVVYHRPPIYTRDDYGVETDTQSTAELLLPNLPALIRPALTADYVMERAGVNIVGAARVYTPNMQTIKGYPNFDQDNNPDFNEIEGWDRFIDRQRSIYTVWTSGTTMTSGSNQYAWSEDSGTLTSNGESISVSGASTSLTYTPDDDASNNRNILEGDRFRFKIKTDDTNLVLTSVVITNTEAESLTYTPTALTVTEDEWLTIDFPFVSGTTATSIYQTGVRYATTVGGTYDYEKDLQTVVFNYTGPGATDNVYLKGVEFYKSISWHVHSLKELNTQFTTYNCVRVRGRRDSIRRSYDT